MLSSSQGILESGVGVGVAGMGPETSLRLPCLTAKGSGVLDLSGPCQNGGDAWDTVAY